MSIANSDMICPPLRARRERVIALHCSGGGASQWYAFAGMLDSAYEMLTPEHYGCEASGP
jgi:hypothetical protein